ncbi:MAG TPA: aminotransferase class V-fold PLP-dependent enzyme [Candidatus Anaerotruncus excrementipullorum]|uniref:Aminotransferase class V-fold PLP-dependent enzyme n=1 Tax=Candidatus Anaerotruncus excrementipullorum TaxID=2838465 RepID=A0A9D2B7E8_9FIRM|nr:aminotransferase class V-fold PLP-dependent enzyme [Candidatus Anaerotruncus excrementipullorum]
MRVYLDQAATSWPKPPEVLQAVERFFTQVGCNVNRGGYAAAYTAAEVVLETRERLCRLFGFDKPAQVIFTAGVTASLNQLLKGLLRPGDHLLVSALEHNAVMRPLAQLVEQGVSFDRLPAGPDGRLPEDLEGALELLLRPNTRMLVVTHASNVCGVLLPLARLGAFCRAHGLWFVVDAAQTGGVESIHMGAMGIDALAFAGHKGLLGPQGLGGFLVRRELAERMEPLVAGGTGSFSHLERMPNQLPDRFEAGTLNLPGIFGLHAALGWLERTGIDAVRQREQQLLERLLSQLDGLPDLRLLGPRDPAQRTAVAALDFPGRDNGEVAFQLDQAGIMVRCGLHCAPNAHRVLGSYPQGAVRLSAGWYNTPQEMDYTAQVIKRLIAG